MISHPPTTIILVRHADVHNPDDLVYGRLPRFGLSQTGWAEAGRTAEALRDTPIAALYSSPQLRARQTARAIAALHAKLPVRISSLLAEVRTGWQGMTNAEMAERHYNFYDPPFGPEDESLADLTGRVARWVAAMLRQYPGETVVGVSHGDPVMTARLYFAGEEPSLTTIRDQASYPQKGSITRLVFPAGDDTRRPPTEIRHEDPNAQARAGYGRPDPAVADAAAQGSRNGGKGRGTRAATAGARGRGR